MSDPLEFTGERFTPECVREIRYEHLHRYALAADFVRGMSVLDAACGEGYGSGILARTAASVTGVDISQAAIGHARARYASSNLAFEVADCCALPFADGHFAGIVSAGVFTSGHVGVEGLDELVRICRPGGVIVLTVKNTLWDGGFSEAVAALQRRGMVSVAEETPPYVSMPNEAATVPSRGLVLRRA